MRVIEYFFKLLFELQSRKYHFKIEFEKIKIELQKQLYDFKKDLIIKTLLEK